MVISAVSHPKYSPASAWSFTTSACSRSNAPLLDFRRGTLNLTGDRLALAAGQRIGVTHDATVQTGAELWLTGGSSEPRG